MNQFYTVDIDGHVGLLSEMERQHLKVLRKQEGDELRIVDGKGKAYLGRIEQIRKRDALVNIVKVIRETSARPLIDIGIAPTKSNDRFEWFLEKSTEIGVGNIYPFHSFHSERKVINKARLDKIILSAMKQSLRLWMPVLHKIQTFDKLIHSESFEQYDKFIPNTRSKHEHLKDKIRSNHKTLVLIGPEGGFSTKELDMAIAANFNSVTLGKARLRTETAGIVACSIFSNS